MRPYPGQNQQTTIAASEVILFSSPKPFTAETRPVQLTAIRSWKRALPGARWILYGSESGLPEICQGEGIEYGGPAETDESGFKIISKIFLAASRLDPEAIFIFVNSDILLDASAQFAVDQLHQLPSPFLATARRRCLPTWTGPELASDELDNFLAERRHPVRWGPACALDIFLFRGFPVKTMPEFRIGQAAWDNWMIYQARWHGIPAIDLSRQLRPFHCDHDYSYVKKNPDPLRPHAHLNRINHELLDGDEKKFHMGHCDHEFAADGRMVRRTGMAFRQRELELLRLRRPRLGRWIQGLRAVFRPWIRKWERYTTRDEDWNQCQETRD